MNQSTTTMRKPLEVWQAVIATVLLLLTVVTIIVNQSNRITRDESEILHLQENKAQTDKHFEEVNTNLKEMNNQLTSIRIILEDKANRQ
jgi:ABC-type multidrug transport system fused ATPase/permease subunit